MIARQLKPWLKKVQSLPQVIQLFGLRQTGKTTLMEELKREISRPLSYSLQDLVTLRQYESRPEQWVLEIESALQKSSFRPLHVFVDEIQKIPELFQGIQGLYDQYKKQLKFWIWGSSARKLKSTTMHDGGVASL